jgi:hypothetical protein
VVDSKAVTSQPRESLNGKVEIPPDNDTVMASDMSGPNATLGCLSRADSCSRRACDGACPAITDQASRWRRGNSCYICTYAN